MLALAGRCLCQWQCLAYLRVLVGCRRGAAGEVSSRGPADKAAAQSSAAAGKPAAPAAEAAQGAGRQPSQQGAHAYTFSLPVARHCGSDATTAALRATQPCSPVLLLSVCFLCVEETRKAPSRVAVASPRPAPPSGQSSSSAAPSVPAKQQAAPKVAPQQAGGPDARPDPRGPKPTNRAERRALQDAQKAAKAATRVGHLILCTPPHPLVEWPLCVCVWGEACILPLQLGMHPLQLQACAVHVPCLSQTISHTHRFNSKMV